nr:MAG TPA: hypothetical protein [Caudoviricetes sp.]
MDDNHFTHRSTQRYHRSITGDQLLTRQLPSC